MGFVADHCLRKRFHLIVTFTVLKGEVFINGIPFERLREWYVKHSGYVLQLAVPYYEELTVRQNLLLDAFMRLPRSFSVKERFERVESVIEQVIRAIVCVLVCLLIESL